MPTFDETLTEAWKIHQSGDLLAAERIYRHVIGTQPTLASAWCYLGIALHDQERYDEAVAPIGERSSSSPQFPIAFNNLGNTLRLHAATAGGRRRLR